MYKRKDYKWRADTSDTRLRNYLYSATDLTTEQFFWNPMVHALDGTEPSLQSLFMDGLDTGWREPTLLNGIVNYHGGYQVARYKRVDNVVYIEGLVKNGSSGDLAVFNLPVGFRPKSRVILVSQRSGGIGRVDISPTGDVVCYGYDNNWTSLSGLSFGIDL